MKKIVMSAIAVVVAIAGTVVSTGTASAGTIRLATGWTLWSKSYCETGSRLVDWRRLQYLDLRQGRQYVYVKNHRLCTFVVDHHSGSHTLSIAARRKSATVVRSYDSGYYSQYAGALTAPASVSCVTVGSELEFDRKVYQQLPKTFCK